MVLSFVLFGLLIVINGSQACSCMNGNRYCASQFAIKVKILSRSEPIPLFEIDPSGENWEHIMEYGLFRYNIEIAKVYRGESDIKSLQTLETYSGSSLCGIKLLVGKWYFLTGYLGTNQDNETVVNTNICMLIEELDKEGSETDMMKNPPNCENPDNLFSMLARRHLNDRLTQQRKRENGQARQQNEESKADVGFQNWIDLLNRKRTV